MAVVERRSRVYLVAVTVVLVLVALCNQNASVAKVTGTLLCLVLTDIGGNMWSATTATKAEKEEREIYLEIASVFARLLVQLTVLLCQEALPKVYSLVAVILLPMLPAVDEPRPAMMLFYLVFHFVLAVVQFKADFWNEGWQWLVMLVFYYGALADMLLSRENNDAAEDGWTLLFKATRSLLSMVCDGYLLLDTTGSIKGMDKKFETFMELQGSASENGEGANLSFDKFLDNPDAKTAAGLRTMTVRTSLGQKYEVEAYTVPCPRGLNLSDSMDMLLGRSTTASSYSTGGRANAPATATGGQGYEGQLFMRAIRVLQSIENQQQSTRRVKRSSASSNASSRTRNDPDSDNRRLSSGDLRDLRGGGGLARRDLEMAGNANLDGMVPRQDSLGTAPQVASLSSGSLEGLRAMGFGGPAVPKQESNPAPGQSSSGELMPRVVAPADQTSDVSAATAPDSHVSAPDVPSTSTKEREQAFPAGPWRSMQHVGLGVGEYTKVRTIAKGSQGIVWEVRSQNQERLAMKEVQLPGLIWQRDFPRLLQNADREVRALKSMAWAEGVVVKLHDCWIGSDFKQANIIMELLPHSLRDVLEGRRRQGQGAPAPHLAARWTAQTTVGLGAIHLSGFIHRDIKPSNLLLTEDLRHCKIADLGVSRPLCNNQRAPMNAPAPSDVYSAVEGGSEVEAGSRIGTDITESSRMTGFTEASSILSGYTQKPGTQAYTSPEALRGGNYDEKLDVFALGCVLLELLTMTSVPNLKRGQGDNLQEAIEGALATAEFGHRQGGKQIEDESGSLGKKGVHAFVDMKKACIQMLAIVPAHRPTPVEVLEVETLRPHVQQLFKEYPRLESIVSSSSNSLMDMRERRAH